MGAAMGDRAQELGSECRGEDMQDCACLWSRGSGESENAAELVAEIGIETSDLRQKGVQRGEGHDCICMI